MKDRLRNTLGHPSWQGIAGIVSIVALIIAIISLKGQSSPPSTPVQPTVALSETIQPTIQLSETPIQTTLSVTPTAVSTPTQQIVAAGCAAHSSIPLSDNPIEPDFTNRQQENWAVNKDDTGNIVLEATTANTGTDIRFGPDLSNGCIEFRFKFRDYNTDKSDESGKLEFNFRIPQPNPQNSVEQAYVLALMPSLERAGLYYRREEQDGSKWEELECQLLPCRSDPLHFVENDKKWYFVTVVIEGANMNTYIRAEDQNEIPLLASNDSRLSVGSFGFAVGPFADVYIDDLKIWKAKQ